MVRRFHGGSSVMRSTRAVISGAAGGLLLGVGICVAFGSARAPAPVSPRYSVQYDGPILLITDNETNKLYVYENTGEKSILRQFVDLSQTGKPELVATKPGKANK